MLDGSTVLAEFLRFPQNDLYQSPLSLKNFVNEGNVSNSRAYFVPLKNLFFKVDLAWSENMIIITLSDV